MARDYESRKSTEAARQARQSAEGRDIGELPEVADPDRKNRGLDSIESFGLEYFPARFPLPVCSAHRTAIKGMESVTNDGGLKAISFFRGGGKTTWSEVAVLRAVLYGLRRFVVLCQATQPLAARSLKKIKRELESNDRLLEDFPEVCFPIRKLERLNNRSRGQTLGGEPTGMEWTADSIVLPTVKGSASSGAVIYVTGIEGALKGLSAVSPEGGILRPDLVLIDDAQTRATAKSPTQTGDRESIITDDILGLAGPEKQMAAVFLCTPIYQNDLSERFLSTERHPEWHGERTKMLPKFPDKISLWDQYSEIRRDSLRSGDEGKRATEFYLQHQAEMDAGSLVTWPERLRAGPFEGVSGLELAMILYYNSPRGFRAEYNCEPEAAAIGDGDKALTPEGVAKRLSGVPRYSAPKECPRLTAFFDPGKKVLWYAVVAWTERFGGSVIDYGCHPRQSRAFFDADDARPTLKDLYPGLDDPKLVFASLKALIPEVLGRTYFSDGGGELRVEKALVDYGWEGESVFQYVRQSPYAGLLHPSKGFGRTAVSRGVGEWAAKAGERIGHHWRLSVSAKAGVRMVQFDSDVWKTFLHGALTVAQGGLTGLTFYGKDPATHEMIAHHCAAEYSTSAIIRGVTLDKWEVRPDRPDNHLWDCIVGAAVAASVAGVQWSASGEAIAPRIKPPKIKMSEVIARKRAEKAGVR